jgi:hypothetical protein
LITAGNVATQPQPGYLDLPKPRSKFSQRCLRCSLLRPDPTQRQRIAEIRDNLLARIAEAQHEGWLGEVEGLKISLTGAEHKLTQLDHRTRQATPVNLGLPTFHDIAGRSVTALRGRP